jgi:hypothetical protein
VKIKAKDGETLSYFRVYDDGQITPIRATYWRDAAFAEAVPDCGRYDGFPFRDEWVVRWWSREQRCWSFISRCATKHLVDAAEADHGFAWTWKEARELAIKRAEEQRRRALSILRHADEAVHEAEALPLEEPTWEETS